MANDTKADLDKLYGDYAKAKEKTKAAKNAASEAKAEESAAKELLIRHMKETFKLRSFKTVDGTSVAIVRKRKFGVVSDAGLREFFRGKRLVKDFYYEQLDKTRLNSYLTQVAKKEEAEAKTEDREPRPLTELVTVVDPETGELVTPIDEERTETISVKKEE